MGCLISPETLSAIIRIFKEPYVNFNSRFICIAVDTNFVWFSLKICVTLIEICVIWWKPHKICVK
jgi:hypothetical protein